VGPGWILFETRSCRKYVISLCTVVVREVDLLSLPLLCGGIWRPAVVMILLCLRPICFVEILCNPGLVSFKICLFLT
jgi:hypothetical protein